MVRGAHAPMRPAREARSTYSWRIRPGTLCQPPRGMGTVLTSPTALIRWEIHSS